MCCSSTCELETVLWVVKAFEDRVGELNLFES